MAERPWRFKSSRPHFVKTDKIIENLMRILGIDLAGSPKHPTGMCVLNQDLQAKSFLVYKDEEIFETVKKVQPSLIAVDAPLSLPRGRSTLKFKSKVHFRECDFSLRKLKIRFFPITLGPMRLLTARGIFLKKYFENNNYKVIEVYPGATQDLLNLPRKQAGLAKLYRGLTGLGIQNLSKKLNGDELDAVTCAYTGWLYLKKKACEIGNPEEGTIVIPCSRAFSKC